MSLKKIIESKNYKIGIWEMNESLSDLISLLPDIQVPNYSNKRKKEFITTRLILNKIHKYQKIKYNKFGAPELNDKKYISISHSNKLCTVIVSNLKVGIDIEKICDRILNISSKFIDQKERKTIDSSKATLFWCIKEAIYKWYQKGGVDFVKDIQIPKLKLSEKGIVSAIFKKTELILNYEKIDDHYLVYICK
ncbi:MAG: hypothetical protein CMD05_05910 [Flavobacteriales bacterium]|nr:hypothetical protein [Flavobacteriales bacterium]